MQFIAMLQILDVNLVITDSDTDSIVIPTINRKNIYDHLLPENIPKSLYYYIIVMFGRNIKVVQKSQ